MPEDSKEALKRLAKHVDPKSFDAGMAYIRGFSKVLGNRVLHNFPAQHPRLLRELLHGLNAEEAATVAATMLEILAEFIRVTQEELIKAEKEGSVRVHQYHHGVTDEHMNRLAAAMRGADDQKR